MESVPQLWPQEVCNGNGGSIERQSWVLLWDEPSCCPGTSHSPCPFGLGPTIGGVSASKDASEPLATRLRVAGPCLCSSLELFFAPVLTSHLAPARGEPSLDQDVPNSRQNQATSVLGKWARFLSVAQQKTLNRFFPHAEPGKRHQRGSFCFCFNQFKPQSSLSFTAPCHPPEARYRSLL